MIALGIDPGIKKSAWALVDCSGRRPRWISGGTTDSLHLCNVVACDVDKMVPFELCAVEEPVPPHEGGKAKTEKARWKIVRDLMKTALVAGEAAGGAVQKCAHVDYLTSHEVRRALCRKPDAEDSDVKRSLQLQVDGLPKKTNEHVRDALATAIVGVWKHQRTVGRRR